MDLKIFILAIAMTFMVTPSFGAWVSGTDLLEWCEPAIGYRDKNLDDDDRVMIGLCAGYIQGWMDLNQYYRDSPYKGEDFMLSLCPPQELEVGPVIEKVTTYLRDNPSKRTMGASGSMAMALQDYSCASATD